MQGEAARGGWMELLACSVLWVAASGPSVDGTTGCYVHWASDDPQIQKDDDDRNTPARLVRCRSPMPTDLPVDVWILQYQEFNGADARAWHEAGKLQWQYHCIEPHSLKFLNTFTERRPIQPRLLFWLAALMQAEHGAPSGWLCEDTALCLRCTYPWRCFLRTRSGVCCPMALVTSHNQLLSHMTAVAAGTDHGNAHP